MAKPRRYPCPACFLPSFGVRLDKYGRPFLKCDMCGTRIFAGSTMKLFNLLSATRLLNVKENLEWVTDQADQQLAQSNPLITVLKECGPDEYDMNAQERKMIASGGQGATG